MKLVLIPSGDVFLGDPPSKQVFRPIKVRFTRPYYAGVYKVTQAEYKAVMGSNPSMFGGRPQNPVERVTFADAIAFCKKLSDREGLPYALPTEGQWERLCRADTTTRWYFGNDGSELGQHAWFAENSGWRPHKVGLKKANPFGIYDVYGNVYEWCEDGYIRGEAQPYDHKAELLGVSVDPRGHPGKLEAFNVIRGGSFLCPADRCRTTRHDERLQSEQPHSDIGLRVIVEVADPKSFLANDWVSGNCQPEALASQSSDGDIIPKIITNSIGMKLAWIPAGEFAMGSDVEGVGSSFDRHRDDESPVHIVQISKPFYLGVYEVMQKEYVAVMGENPVPDYRNERGPDLPAGYIRFKDAEEFCRRLSEKEDKKYRLPTEAEWEYACRASTTTMFAFGNTLTLDQANVVESWEEIHHYNSGAKPTRRGFSAQPVRPLRHARQPRRMVLRLVPGRLLFAVAQGGPDWTRLQSVQE